LIDTSSTQLSSQQNQFVEELVEEDD